MELANLATETQTQMGMLSPIGTTLAWKKQALFSRAIDILRRVDTAALDKNLDLGITSVNRALGIAYDPSPWSALRQAMKLAAVDAPGLSFVDVGCGKGRIVLAAMAYPFKDIIGIDYSATLCDIARENVSSARLLPMRIDPRRVVIVCKDATQWQRWPHQAVLWFDNPFRIEITQQVLRNIIACSRFHDTQLVLLFHRMSSSIGQIDAVLTATPPSPQGRSWRKIVTAAKLAPHGSSLNVWAFR